MECPNCGYHLKKSETVCPYCSTLYVYDAALKGHADPAECEFHGA